MLVANELTTMHTGCYFVAPGEIPGVKEPGHKVCPLTLQHAVLSIEDDSQAPNLHPEGLQVDFYRFNNPASGWSLWSYQKSLIITLIRKLNRSSDRRKSRNLN